jgi:hypothetical protein
MGEVCRLLPKKTLNDKKTIPSAVIRKKQSKKAR